jgi:CheY-like chemotaxis protein
METLRTKYHDLGNKINNALMGVGIVKKYLSMMSGNERDLGHIKDSIDTCVMVETALLELDRELSKIKGITYRLVDPDKSVQDYMNEMKSENQGFKILIVDDEKDLCEILKKTYMSRGFQVDIAMTLEEAKKVILQESPQIVLLDLYLSNGMDGLEILRFLKKEKPGTRCLVITKEDDEKRLKEVRDLGPDGILIKPVMAHQLDAKISGLFAALRK